MKKTLLFFVLINERKRRCGEVRERKRHSVGLHRRRVNETAPTTTTTRATGTWSSAERENLREPAVRLLAVFPATIVCLHCYYIVITAHTSQSVLLLLGVVVDLHARLFLLDYCYLLACSHYLNTVLVAIKDEPHF